MAKLIKFRAQCFVCGEWFDAGKAWLTLRKGEGWKCQCFACYKKRKEDKKTSFAS